MKVIIIHPLGSTHLKNISKATTNVKLLVALEEKSKESYITNPIHSIFVVQSLCLKVLDGAD